LLILVIFIILLSIILTHASDGYSSEASFIYLFFKFIFLPKNVRLLKNYKIT